MTLETRAMAWLRFEERCPIALMERTPVWGHGRPYVIGVTRDRYIVEIEVKRSMAAKLSMHILNNPALQPDGKDREEATKFLVEDVLGLI